MTHFTIGKHLNQFGHLTDSSQPANPEYLHCALVEHVVGLSYLKFVYNAPSESFLIRDLTTQCRSILSRLRSCLGDIKNEDERDHAIRNIIPGAEYLLGGNGFDIPDLIKTLRSSSNKIIKLFTAFLIHEHCKRTRTATEEPIFIELYMVTMIDCKVNFRHISANTYTFTASPGGTFLGGLRLQQGSSDSILHLVESYSRCRGIFNSSTENSEVYERFDLNPEQHPAVTDVTKLTYGNIERLQFCYSISEYMKIALLGTGVIGPMTQRLFPQIAIDRFVKHANTILRRVPLTQLITETKSIDGALESLMISMEADGDVEDPLADDDGDDPDVAEDDGGETEDPLAEDDGGETEDPLAEGEEDPEEGDTPEEGAEPEEGEASDGEEPEEDPEEPEVTFNDKKGFEIKLAGEATLDVILFRTALGAFIKEVLNNPPKDIPTVELTTLDTIVRCYLNILAPETLYDFVSSIVKIPIKIQRIETVEEEEEY